MFINVTPKERFGRVHPVSLLVVLFNALPFSLTFFCFKDLFINAVNDDERKHIWYIYVNFFRVGRFSEANEVVQQAWFHFCGDILVHVNKQWNCKMTQANKLVSEVCTVSDEAFALQIGKTQMAFWISKYVSKEEGLEDVIRSLPKEPLPFSESFDEASVALADNLEADKQGEENQEEEDDDDEDNNEDEGNKSYDKILSSGYYALYDELHTFKTESFDDWKTWDEGYKAHLRSLHPKTISMSGNTNNDDEDTAMVEPINHVIEQW